MIATEYQAKASGELAFFRGAILTAYCQYEWFLAKIVIQASYLPEYSGLELSFTQQASGREDRVSTILERQGAFAKYREPLAMLIAAMKQFAEIRNFMAHGLSVVRYEGENSHYIELRMFKAFKGGETKDGRMIFGSEQIASVTQDVAKIILEFISLMRVMAQDPDLPTVEVDWE